MHDTGTVQELDKEAKLQTPYDDPLNWSRRNFDLLKQGYSEVCPIISLQLLTYLIWLVEPLWNVPKVLIIHFFPYPTTCNWAGP